MAWRRDYSIYLPPGQLPRTWGLAVTAAGHTRIRPGSAYPPGAHPSDHALSWDRGRTLQAYQVIFISAGRGRFDSAATGPRKIAAGTVFLLFPGVWHRYEPIREAGWTEDWFELVGPAADRLSENGIISPDCPVYRVGGRAGLDDLFARCHRLMRDMPRGFRPVLGSIGMQILATVAGEGRSSVQAAPAAEDAIRKAQRIIAESSGRPLNMEELAESLAMSYSHFRRAFKQSTGLSPKQYHLQLRLRRVQELLAGTSLSIKQIADRLGYDSPFHLSADFKARMGLSPQQWRAQTARAGSVTAPSTASIARPPTSRP